MKESLTRQGLTKKYTFDPPVTTRVQKVLQTFDGIQTVLSDPAKFKVIYEKFGYGSMLMFDEIAKYVLPLLIFPRPGYRRWGWMITGLLLGTIRIRP